MRIFACSDCKFLPEEHIHVNAIAINLKGQLKRHSGLIQLPLPKILKYMMTFEGLGLDSKLIQATNELGFQTPTPIQEKAIPVKRKKV